MHDQKAYMKQWRKAKMAAGLCTVCGRDPVRPGMTKCPECLRLSKIRKAQMRERIFTKTN